LVPQIYVALQASRTALQMVSLKISPLCSPTNAGLNFVRMQTL
jgi:hypothetical protein